MCQTDLPGSWNHPSSDQCRPCCCMMHVSERSLPDQRLFFIYHPHNTVDFRYLHTFFRTHRWKDPCDTAGCHCLSTARRTDQQQIMTSCHCNFCCPSDIFSVHRDLQNLEKLSSVSLSCTLPVCCTFFSAACSRFSETQWFLSSPSPRLPAFH